MMPTNKELCDNCSAELRGETPPQTTVEPPSFRQRISNDIDTESALKFLQQNINSNMQVTEDNSAQAPLESDVLFDSSYKSTDNSSSQLRAFDVRKSDSDMSDVEASFRHAQVCMKLEKWEKAAEQLNKVLALQPDNKTAAKLLKKCNKKI